MDFMRGLLCRRVLAGSLLLALCGCAAPPPFQAMKSTTDLGYGYKDTKIDASHYSVAYAGDREESAQNYLEERAAQIAAKAGFAYFSFNKRGVELLRRTDSDLVAPERLRRTDAGIGNVNDFLPDNQRRSITNFYYAWGEIALLSADQAKADPKALQVSAVLARPGAPTAPP